MKNKRKFLSLIFLLALIITIGGEFLSALGIKASAAEAVTYSNVLDDLKNAENFSTEKYPILTLDYLNGINSDTDAENDQALMEVISIAESSSGELIIYVYQPTDSELDLTASAVLLSTEFTPDGQNINPKIYNLDLVSSDSVFDKYVVKDFHVSEEPYRYYNLVTLYRNFNPAIDEVTAGGVIENFELGIGVGQQWCVYYQNDKIVYEMNTFDTVEIDIGYTGSVEFSSGFTIGNIAGSFDYGDAWFIAFNVEDYIVNKIYDADLAYKIRDKRASGDNVEYGEWSSDIKVTLKEGDVATYQGDGLFAKEYTWNKICSSSDFVAQLEEQDVKISEDAKNELSKNLWVFSFLQTEKEATVLGTGSVYIKSLQVSSVTVIRLHFMDIKGDVYNLGVVSDRVSPDDTPDAVGDGVEIASEWFEKVFMILLVIALLLVFIFLFPFVRALFELLFSGIKFLFEILLIVIAFPFRFIRFLFTGKWK